MGAQPGAGGEHRRADYVRNFDRIVEGATIALASDAEASMDQIAKASGVARATLYRHFDNRQDLLREIYRSGLDAAAEAIDAAEPEHGDASAAIGRLIEALLVVGDRYRIITEQGLDYPELLPRAEEAFAPVGELIERGQKQRTIREDLGVPWLTAAMVTLIVAAIRAIGRGDLGADEAAEVVATTFLQAIQIQPDNP